MKPGSKAAVLFGWLIAFVLGTGCGGPAADKDPQSIRDRVVSASQGYEPVDGARPSGPFADTGFHTAFHSADWIISDPFTDATEYFVSVSALSHSYPYEETKRIIARSRVSSQQALLMVSHHSN